MCQLLYVIMVKWVAWGPTVQQVLFQLGLDPDDALLVDLTAPLARFSRWVRSWR